MASKTVSNTSQLWGIFFHLPVEENPKTFPSEVRDPEKSVDGTHRNIAENNSKLLFKKDQEDLLRLSLVGFCMRSCYPLLRIE